MREAVTNRILISIVVFMGLWIVGYEGYLYAVRVAWNNAYDDAVSKYKAAYAHRDDRGNMYGIQAWLDYEAAEKELEARPTQDPLNTQKVKDLYACGISLKAYHDLREHKFGAASFDKAAGACAQPAP